MTMTHSSTMLQQPESETDVLISGAGPAGLIAAIVALGLGKKITIIEKRAEELAALRPQLVFLNKSSKEHLSTLASLQTIKLTEDEKKKDQRFIQVLKAEKEKMVMHFAIKDIQRFLLRRITANTNCTFLFNAELTTINMEMGSAHVKQDDVSKKIHFQTIIGAEGAYSKTAELTGIKYKPIYSRQRKKMINAYIKISAKDKVTVPFYKADHGMELIALDSHKNIQSGILYFQKNMPNTSEHILKAMITMTAPDDLYDELKLSKKERDVKSDVEMDNTKGLDYLKEVLYQFIPAEKFDISISESKLPEKNKLKFQIFDMQLFQAEKFAIEVNKRKLILLGDAGRKPDFYLGHGINDIITEYRPKLKFFLQNKMTVGDYNEFFEVLSDDYIEKTKERENRVECRVSARKNQLEKIEEEEKAAILLSAKERDVLKKDYKKLRDYLLDDLDIKEIVLKYGDRIMLTLAQLTENEEVVFAYPMQMDSLIIVLDAYLTRTPRPGYKKYQPSSYFSIDQKSLWQILSFPATYEDKNTKIETNILGCLLFLFPNNLMLIPSLKKQGFSAPEIIELMCCNPIKDEDHLFFYWQQIYKHYDLLFLSDVDIQKSYAILQKIETECYSLKKLIEKLREELLQQRKNKMYDAAKARRNNFWLWAQPNPDELPLEKPLIAFPYSRYTS